jgi:hypothetical protein
MHATPVDPPGTSVENCDPALRPLELSNTTSEPLSSCGLCLRLIGDWGVSHKSKRRRVMADPGRDWYSWSLPILCLILLAGLDRCNSHSATFMGHPTCPHRKICEA